MTVEPGGTVMLEEVTTITDATVRDTQQMGSLLQRMTAETSGEVKFTPDQVNAMIEIFIPRFVTSAPGMPAGMQCKITERDDSGWTIRIDR